MKNLLLIFAAIVIAVSANAKSANDTTVCFTISPAMSCVNCENKIKTNLRFEKGISAIEANAPGDRVSVKFNRSKTNEIKIVKAFEKIGYKATPACTKANANTCTKANAHTCTKGKTQKCTQKCGKDNSSCCKSKNSGCGNACSGKKVCTGNKKCEGK